MKTNRRQLTLSCRHSSTDLSHSTEMDKEEKKQQGSRQRSDGAGSSRFLSPASPSRTTNLSPLRRKLISDPPPRKHQSSSDRGGLWPSSTTTRNNNPATAASLADHLSNERLADLADRTLLSVTRQRSCSEFSRFEDSHTGHRVSKENRPTGGSMRYINKLRFPGSSSSSLRLLPGRASVNDVTSTVLSGRRKSDFGADFPSSESDRSSETRRIPRWRYQEPKSAQGHPAIKRTSSLTGYGSAATQWALSPGRRSNSPPAVEGASPGKERKAGKNFISIGLDLFRRKSFSGPMSSSPLSRVGSPAAGEMTHQFRMMHNRLIQWRYVNATSDAVNKTRMQTSQSSLVRVSAEMSKLQGSVAQNKARVEKERFRLKLNTILKIQMKVLEGWADMERQHTSAVSTTKDCLQTAVCRLPLTNGAKVDSQALSTALRQATDLTLTIKRTINPYTPMVQNTVPLISELAEVVTREKSLLEECLELLGYVSNLQVQEESIRCHLIQLKSSQQLQLNERKLITINNLPIRT